MGDSKLCLLLLLSTSALAVAQDGDQPTCLLAQRYKTLHKYQYRYEAESLNAINGASALKNGPKASCMVEIEVPQTCSLIVRTTDCSLSEVVDMDAEGNPVFAPAPTSDAFAAEMARYPLKVVVEGVYDVELYPEEGETTTILNIKRGIISALAVPLTEEDKNKNMPTIHGKCKTAYTINAREDIATDITLNRDLSRCDNFVPMRDHTSPLALISGMHYPLAQLVRSSQTCNYKFDNERKHMTSGSCTENHILIPFSHKGEYGVTNVGKQELTLVDVSAHNDRVFERSDIVKGLHMEAVEEKTAVQDKDAWLALLRELVTLPETEGDRRAHLFHKLVTMVRGMKTETLTPAIPEALEVSRLLTYQVLAQCGTPECSSAIMQILRTFDSSSLEVDATVVAMGLVSNPSALLIHDMLEMAKYKSSKPIMYALSNVVKRFYKMEGKMIPEIHSVAEFMAAQLGDCSGDKDNTFMTLRVVGNMAPAVVPASPALRAAVMQCVNQPAASPTVQQAAIQVYRLTPVPEEAREVLMQVLLDTTSALQKRIAAYLVLMKDPQPSELAQLVSAMSNEQDQQLKSFVISHMTNIMSSTEPETTELRDKIQAALQGNEIGPIMDATKFSRNYKIGSVEGNIIFEGSSYLPRELMLEMTLKAFGFDIDMMEIGMEGKGFEPTVDALFGENGFFPDTTLKTMYFVSDNMPLKIQEVMHNILPTLRRDRMKRQASQNLMREVGRNLNKLVSDLKAAESPEAMVYLRLLGNELGYLRTNEMEEMAYSAAMMIDNMLKMFPAGLIMEMMTKTDNTMFAHYIFMDNEFFMPTATGVPLRIALSGTFTPGIKGGLKISRDMSEVAFMPSAGVEFATQVGSHIPEYVDSGLEMLTNIFHESGLTAKISMERDQVKLTIPAPTNPTKIIKMTNTIVAVSGSEVKPMPPMVTDKVDVSECTPFFAGMKYCTALQYTDAFSVDTAPYFPFTGDSKFAVELHPTGEVTEYTATVAYELLREGEEGRQKVDSVKFIVRAEGAAPTEARAIMKYNRRRNVLTANFEIPDYDLEAGFRLGVVDGNTKGKGTHSISLDLINKNVPQLSLVGRAKLEAMRKGMLQVQLLVPFLSTNATVTALMTREEELEMELKSEIKVLEAMSEQKIEMKYDGTKVEVKVKSGVNADTTMMPNADVFEKYGNQLLDTQMGQTDMKVREVFVKFVEVANNYMEQYADIPYIQNLRVPDMPEISLPESLFLNTEAKAVYYFNDEHLTIAIPLPLGGKSTEELFQSVFTTPYLSLPQFGLEIPSMDISIPEMFVPESITLSIPLFGKAEVSALMKSNLYDMEASMAAGKDVVEAPSYSAMFDVRGTSPIDILSFKVEGSGMLATTDSVKAQLKSSLAHKLIEASVSIVEDASITDKLNVKSSSKIEITSPFGLNISLEHTGLAGINTEEISADSNFDGMFKAGPIYGKAVSTQTSTIFPFRPEAKIDSSVQIDSSIVKAQNTIEATLANGEFSVVSNTKAFEDIITHVGELSFKDNKLALTCDTNAAALGMRIRHQAEASAGADGIVMKSETNGGHSENRIYSLLTASLDVSGVSVNSDATVRLFENEATHKVVLTMNKDGLTTTGTNTLQSPLFMENTFDATLATSRASLSINNKATMRDMKVDNGNTLMITLSTLNFNSKTVASASEEATYTQDIIIDLKPYTASASVNNNLKVFAANLINEAQLQAELYKMDLTGSLKAIFGDQEIKHTYQVNYADLSANAKCSTIGRLLGTHMSHNTDLEIIGLAARLTNDARFISEPMRFDHTIRCSIVPFDFNLDAIFNGDGEMMMFGKHSAQLYGKFLVKAQPLNFASSHECRASMAQQLDSGLSLETTYENKLDTLLSLEEQRATYKMKSKMNEHAFNNDLSLYNNPERTGIEASAIILTNIINSETTDNQEFGMSGFLKYDKSTNSHVIHFPLMEFVPVLLEEMKGFIVRVAEVLQNFISNEEIRAQLVALPEDVSEFVSNLNIEGRVMKLKEYFSDLSQNYLVSVEDVEASLANLKVTFRQLITDFTSQIQRLLGMLNEMIDNNNLPEALIRKIEETLIAFNEAFDIKRTLIYVIDTMKAMVQHIDLEKLRGSSIAFLHDLDNNLHILSDLQMYLDDLKNFLENFDMLTFVTQLKERIAAIDFSAPVVYLRQTVFEFVEYVDFLIREYDIFDMINTFFAKIRTMLVNLNIDQKVQQIFEKVLELINQFRIRDTINTVVQMLKDADIPSKAMHIYQVAIDYLKTTEIKDIIHHLNTYIEVMVDNVKSWDYNNFVDYTNRIIAEYTSYVNELIRALEIPQKLEAARDFINYIFSSAKGVMDQVKEIKIAEIVKSLKVTIDQVVFDDLKRFFEMLKEDIRTIGIPSQMNIPEFTILGFYTVPATTISVDDIKQKIIQLLDFIINFDIQMTDVDAFFGDLTMNYLPSMPEINLPEITLPEISFPTIPQVPVEKLIQSIQVPEFKLPTIPTEIVVPCFGKLYGEIKFTTPIYTMKTYAEFQNTTANPLTPQFAGVFTSQATSPNYEIVEYNLESSAHIALPKRSRIVLTENLKFTHVALGVDHQGSVSLYGLAAQAQAKTLVKVTTTPYTADFMNTAFIGLEGGMSASIETIYNHQLNLPVISLTSEATLSQTVVARLDGLTLTLTVDNTGKGKINEEAGNHKCKLELSLTPKVFTLTFTGDTDSMLVKMKQLISAESNNLDFITFNVRTEAESPFIKNMLVVGNGRFSLYDMKAELRANHDTELVGSVSGVLSNGVHLVAKPFDIVFEFQNKGNTKVNILDAIKAKIDLQNDYSVILKTGSQQINTMGLARFNQFKMSYNFTIDNNENEAGISVAMDNAANLDFLTYPVSIPEIDLPFIDFHSPAINDVNLYEQTGLRNLLLTTDQSLDVDAKIVYKKGQNAPIATFMDLIYIPSVGDLITELSFKSAIINLNVNAGLYTEDDLVFRLGATSASEFEGLQAKLDGTTSLTTKRGIKLANSLSLENSHLQGTHDSTISMSTDNLETAVSVATIAKIALPILNLEASQNLIADTRIKAKTQSTLKMKCDFNLPMIRAVGKADADHSLKMEANFEDVSMESAMRANMDGTVLDDYLALGMLDTDFNVYLSKDGLRSTSKVISDAKLNRATTKVLSMDINENLAIEASLSRVYAVLNYIGNNEVNLFNFNTNGKHLAQATVDLTPTSALTADVEINVSQLSSVGNFSVFEKTVAEVALSKQKISTNAKFVSPLYTTTMATELEGNAPVFKATFKSAATSVFVFFEHDMDASSTTTFESEAVSMMNKATLTHTDLAMDVYHVFSHVWRRDPQADDSVSRHTLSVDITSPTFTDVNLRYAARRDSISASVSTPSTGFFGLQFTGRMPTQMSARVYGRYPSAPDVDVDVLTIRSSPLDTDKMNLQIAYNMEAPKMMLSELKMKFQSIISTLTEFADKYQITGFMMELKSNIVNRFSEAYNAAINYDDQLSQLSIFFRYFIVQYQKTVQVFLDAAIKVLRETQFKLPGSEEMTTLPEVLKRLTSSIAAMLETTIQMVQENTAAYYNIFVEKISNITVRMPIGDAITGRQMLDQVNIIVKTFFNEMLDFVKNMESLDTMLVKIGETLNAIVEKSQEFIDSIQSDYLDAVFANINIVYRNFVTVIKNLMDQISAINMEQLNAVYDNVMDMLIYVVDQFNIIVNNFMQQASAEIQAYIKVNGGRLEIDLPVPFHQ